MRPDAFRRRCRLRQSVCRRGELSRMTEKDWICGQMGKRGHPRRWLLRQQVPAWNDAPRGPRAYVAGGQLAIACPATMPDWRPGASLFDKLAGDRVTRAVMGLRPGLLRTLGRLGRRSSAGGRPELGM